jgi:hypothetical protein
MRFPIAKAIGQMREGQPSRALPGYLGREEEAR